MSPARPTIVPKPEEHEQPWQWPEQRWRGIVERVRAGRTLRPDAWPGGARCAVALSFDSDHETSELREGGESIGRLSQGQYGNRAGRAAHPRRCCSGTPCRRRFFVPAVVGACSIPTSSAASSAEGHEIGIHGWIHERNSVLPPRRRARPADARGRHAGEDHRRSARSASARRRGTSARTRSRITREMGLLYDSSLMADDDCYELLLDGEPTGVVELPVEWIRDDAVYFNMNRFAALRPYTPPVGRARDLPARVRRGLCARAGCSSSPCTRTSSATARACWILEELIQHIRAHAGVWFATHADVVRYVKQGS